MPEASALPQTREATVVCPAPEDTAALGEALGSQLAGGDVVVLDGPLGAGKTTFTQGLARGLGVTSPVTSPTFVLARHQRPDPHGPRPDGPVLLHVDAYRVGDGLEWDDLDLDSDLDASVVVVEWGAGLAERLAAGWVHVTIERPQGAEPGAAEGLAPTEQVVAPRTLRVRLDGRIRDLDLDALHRAAARREPSGTTPAPPPAAGGMSR